MIKILLTLSVFLTGEIHAQQNYNKLNVKELDVTSRVNVTSTTKSSKPCPAMTETQRNAIATPLNGSCIYNATTSKLNVYNGSVWKAAGGGVDNWLTATAYSVDDIVIESAKIYQCLTAHTSGTFATDLVALKWAEISSTIPVNLTGPITSVGNATSIASQTGTGSTFVVQNTPTLTTPNIGVATGTSLTLAGNISAYNYDKDNMLVNGNIENPLSTEWTCTVGTCSRTTTAGEFSKDTAALKVVLSAQSMNVSQTVTTPSGIQKQGYARVIYRVPATMADFQICTLVDAAEQTCVPTTNLIKDDTFRSIEIPLTFGTTSAGIKFKTTSSYTATAYFDGVILAQGLGTQNLQGDTVYSVQNSSANVQSNISKAGWVSSCTGLNPFTCNFQTGLFTATPNCNVTSITGAGSGIGYSIDSISTTSIVYRTFTTTTAVLNGQPTVISCQKSGNDYLAASSNVYSQASANYGPINAGAITIGATTTPPTKGTIVTDRVLHTRIGNRMIAEYQYEQSASGTAGTGDYLFTLPDGKSFDSSYVNFYTGDVGGAGAAVAAQKSFVGSGVIGNGSARGRCELIAYSATQFRARCETVYTNQIFFGSAIYTLNGAIGFALTIDAPISGWSNSNVIVGSFEGIEKCANAYECTDTFTADISSTGVVSNQNIPWISGNCVVGSYFTCTYLTILKDGVNPLSSNMNCNFTATDVGTEVLNVSAGSSPIQHGYNTYNSSGSSVASRGTLRCSKGSLDYKPKTAKVASSIGVPTVPGISTEAIDTFSVSYGTTNATTVCSASPCSYLDQIGNSVTSVTRSAAGSYTVNLGKTYTKLKGIVNSASVGAGSVRVPEIVQCSSCSSVSFKTLGNTGADGDSSGTIFFQGTY